VTLGNPRLAEVRDKANAASMAAADAFAANVLPIIREIQASGVQSFRGIAHALTARGIKTARGGTWTPVQVSDILRR
jgi:Recombinase